jgi:hypothetical protein
MMPYACDSVNMIVQAFERGQHPAIYLRDLRTYDGTAGLLTKTGPTLPLVEGAHRGSMEELAAWTVEADRVMTF